LFVSPEDTLHKIKAVFYMSEINYSGTTTERMQCKVPNTSNTPQSLTEDDIPFGIMFWKIGKWVVHIMSWVMCGLAFYWIKDAVHPVLFIIMLGMFFRLEYNMIFKNKRGF
jgi:hypothetical protein